MAREGGKVVIADINEVAGAETVRLIKAEGHEASFIRVDLRDSASKGGVAMLTKASATDLAKFNIRVNCYCPASIHTPMLEKYLDAAPDPAATEAFLRGEHLLPRLGEPEEIAKLAVFLACSDSSFINGAAYLIDGGALAWRGLNG